MRFFIKYLLFFCFFEETYAQKPNVIIIMADDLGYNDVGFLNPKTFNFTPSIDSLAQKSVRLTNFYATPTCSPTRASLMTGQYPSRHGIYAVDAFAGTPKEMKVLLGGQSKNQLDKETFMLPVLFKSAGYQTGLVGKWHLGNNPLTYQNKPIFDKIIGRSLPNEGHLESYYDPYHSVNDLPEDADAPKYITDRLTYEACKFIHENKQKPFFLYLAHYAPHVPLHAKKEDVEVVKNRKASGNQNRPEYSAMVYSVDRSVKAVMQQLKAAGVAENTIIIFMSDNGGQIMSTDNTPLSGQKGEILEGGIKVPFFIYSKNLKPIENASVTSVVDILPTLAGMCELKMPQNIPFDGKNLSPVFEGKTDKNRSVFFHTSSYTGNGKSNGLVWQTPSSVVRKGKWKLIQSLEDDTVQLFDVEKDLAESQNVAPQNSSIVEELLSELKKWQIQTGALIPTEKNAEYNPASRAWTLRKNTRLEKDNTNIKVQ